MAEQIISKVKRFIGTAEFYITKADREYAYYINDTFGEKEKHYAISQSCYKDARYYLERAQELIDDNNITDPEQLLRLSDLRNKLDKNKRH